MWRCGWQCGYAELVAICIVVCLAVCLDVVPRTFSRCCRRNRRANRSCKCNHRVTTNHTSVTSTWRSCGRPRLVRRPSSSAASSLPQVDSASGRAAVAGVPTRRDERGVRRAQSCISSSCEGVGRVSKLRLLDARGVTVALPFAPLRRIRRIRRASAPSQTGNSASHAPCTCARRCSRDCCFRASAAAAFSEFSNSARPSSAACSCSTLLLAPRRASDDRLLASRALAAAARWRLPSARNSASWSRSSSRFE